MNEKEAEARPDRARGLRHNWDRQYTGPRAGKDTNGCGDAAPLVSTPKTTVTFYSVSNGSYKTVKAVMRCDACGKDGLATDYNYCPNCGLKFNK